MRRGDDDDSAADPIGAKRRSTDLGVFAFFRETQSLWLGILPILLVAGFAIRAEIREANAVQDSTYSHNFVSREEFEQRMKAFEGKLDDRARVVDEKLREIRDEQKDIKAIVQGLARK